MESIKLHLGCGPNIKAGYINIDGYVTGEGIVKMDILNLDFKENSVDEILAEHLFEHLPFKDEEQLFTGCFKVLKPGGVLTVETPDMEWLCAAFLAAQDEFSSFYKVGNIDHYFGHGKSYEHRWGMITTHFFGNQNGEGQFHKNGYTKKKFEDIAKLVGFSSCEVIKLVNKGAGAIRARLVK